jgi:hypothetical protein
MFLYFSFGIFSLNSARVNPYILQHTKIIFYGIDQTF